MRGLAHTEVITGEARFVATATLQVNGRQITAPRIFLNVGGRSVRPQLQGIDDVPTLDNVSIMELATVPEHLVIVGGSYIGLEFAQMMRRFGAQVTVVERSARLLPREDADVSDGIREIFQAEGVRFELEAECLSLAQLADGISVGAQCADERSPIVASHVLLAVGRQLNTDTLGLEHAGIRMDAKGYIEVDDQCRTIAAGVWAVGDCNAKAPSRTLPGTTTRSWWPTCSTTTRAASRTASPAMRSSSTRRWAAWACPRPKPARAGGGC